MAGVPHHLEQYEAGRLDAIRKAPVVVQDFLEGVEGEGGVLRALRVLRRLQELMRLKA